MPVRHLTQARHHLLLPLLLGQGSQGARHEADISRAVANLAVLTAYEFDDVGHLRRLPQDGGCSRRDPRRIRQCTARRQFDFQRRAGEILRRDERRRYDHQTGHRQRKEYSARGDGLPAVSNTPAQHPQIARHDRPVGIVYDEGVAAQRVGSQYRSDEPRDHERDEDGRRDSQAELLEVLAAHTAHETYRQKHRDDGGRRRHHRQADFVRRIDGRLKAALAHAHVPNDVFYFDDGVVHEYAGNQREPEQRDLIEGEAHPLHEDEGGYRRQRNGQRGDHRRAHIAQKKPYDGDRENRPFHEGAHRRVVGAHGMVDRGENGCHADRGILGPDLVQLGVDRARHGDIRGALGFEHAESGRRAAVESRDGAHLCDAIVHVGNFAQAHRFPSGNDHLGIPERLRRSRAGQHADRLFAAAHLGAAAGGIHVERSQLLIDFDGGEAQSLQPAGVQFDSDLAVDAAASRHLCDAGDREQPFGHGIVDEPAELCRGQARRSHRIVGECAAVDVDSRHQRFEYPLRQIIANFGDRVANIGYRTIDRRTDLELHEARGLTLDDVGRDIAHIADVRYRAFHLLCDLRFHLGRRGARLSNGDVDHGKGHIRIKIDGQANERDDAQEKQHDEQHDRRDRMTDGPSRNIFHVRLESFKTGLTSSPSCKNAPAVATTWSLLLTPSAMVTPFCTIPDTRTARRSTLCCAFTIKT